MILGHSQEPEMKERQVETTIAATIAGNRPPSAREAAAEEIAKLNVKLLALDRNMQWAVAQHERRLKELEGKFSGSDYCSGHHAVENNADAVVQTADAVALDYATKENEEKSNVAIEALLQRVDELEARHRGLEEENAKLQKGYQALKEARKSDEADDCLIETKLEDGICLTTEDISKFVQGYTVQETVWDTIIFIGFDCVPIRDQIAVIASILTSMAIEFAFVLVVIANYSVHSFPDDMLDGLLHWRAVVAHDIANFDPVTGTSLAARVCENEVSTDKSAFQMKIYDDLLSFRFSQLGEVEFLNGYFLCNVALILWFSNVMRELLMGLRFTCAILEHPRGKAIMKRYGEDDIKIMSLSRLQVVCAVFLVSIPRIFIATLLGWSGVFFLAFTHDVNELLLNAVALGFVLSIDEDLYHSLTPRSIKVITPFLAPLRNTHPDNAAQRIKKVRRLFQRKTIIVLVVIVLIINSNIFIMHPFTERLDKAMSYICSGNKDVLFTSNQLNGLVMYADSPHYEVEAAHRMTYHKRAVLEIIGMDPDFFKDKVIDLTNGDNYKNSFVSLSLPSLRDIADGSRRYVASASMCIDHTDTDQIASAYPGDKGVNYYQATKLQFSSALGMPSFTSCHELDFVAICLGSSVLSLGRALCARFCGCDNPWTGQFFATGYAGCPENCGPRWALAAFYQVPSDIAEFTDLCEDVPAALLVKQDFWKHYVIGVKNQMLMFESEFTVDKVAEQLLTKGCGYLTKLRFLLDVCEPNVVFRSARLFCPATCMCASSDMKECPSSCTYTMPHQVMSPGFPCPFGLEISSANECEHAAEEILMRPKHIDDYQESTGGCFLSHGYLYWSNGSVHNTIPTDYTVLCKQAQPFLPNEISKGQFIYGKQCAECILSGSACAEDCYITHSVPYHS